MKKAFAFLLLSSLAFGDIQQCYIDASQRYGVPIKLLYAITKVESDGKPFCININSHGRSIWSKCYQDYSTAYYVAKNLYDRGYNIDLGLMQINSQNMKDNNWSVSDVLNPCHNVYYGAYLLRENINRYGFNWTAIWHYNGSPAYAYKVAKALENLNYNFAYTSYYTYQPFTVFEYSNGKISKLSSVRPKGVINNGYFTVITGG